MSRSICAAITALVLTFAGAGPLAAEVSSEILTDILTAEQTRNLADGKLFEYAAHDDADVRARAILALGRLQDPATIPTLTAGLDDEDAAVRHQAIFAMGQLFNTQAEATLLDVVASAEGDDALWAIEALGKSGSEQSVAPLGVMVIGDDLPRARAAAIALGGLAIRNIDIASTGRNLGTALRNDDEELRWKAGFAVQRGATNDALTGLRHALKRDDSLTLIFAAKGIASLRSKENGRYVTPLLQHDDWRVRVEGLRALATMRAQFETGEASLLLDDPNMHVVLTAIDTMGRLAGGGGLGRLRDLENSSDWRIRSAVITAKARGRGDGALPDMRAAAKDPDPRIRMAAAQAFGLVPTEQSLVLIEELFQDESPMVQAALVNSLVQFPQIAAVHQIRPFIASGDPAVVTSAADAAGQRYDYDAVPYLLEAYDKLISPVDTEPMQAILGALGSILTATVDDDPVGELSDADRARAEALLESALADTDINVARTAADALSQVRGELVDPVTADTGDLPTHLDFELARSLEADQAHPEARVVTNRGVITIRLNGAAAPGTVANFVTLAREGYYNGLQFHRVVADFVIQGGDPRGDGWGGPGYAIRCEYHPGHYERGKVGMALAGKDTGGSQFFITHSPQPHLDGRFTIFGEVTDGMDVVDKIQRGDVINEIQLTGI